MISTRDLVSSRVFSSVLLLQKVNPKLSYSNVRFILLEEVEALPLRRQMFSHLFTVYSVFTGCRFTQRNVFIEVGSEYSYNLTGFIYTCRCEKVTQYRFQLTCDGRRRKESLTPIATPRQSKCSLFD